MNKLLQLTEHTGEGRGKPGAGRGLWQEAEESRGDRVGFVVFLLVFFSISLHTAHCVDVCETDCREGIAIDALCSLGGDNLFVALFGF